ncbi:MAG: hypothetical protein LBR20_06680 [Propionibacteriaceae bacterium]|nr:hypothetical protein [Propionibacteriaceae bacterium]
MPRRRQEDRRRRRGRRGGYHVTAPQGLYAGIPVIDVRTWVSHVVPEICARHPEVLRKHKCSPQTMARWAVAKAGYARPESGQVCIVTPYVLGQVLGVSERTVQRYNACARELGIEVVVLEGCLFGREERITRCWETGSGEDWRPPSKQRGLATEVALTVPPELRTRWEQPDDVVRVTPPPCKGGYSKFYNSQKLPWGPSAQRKDGASRRHRIRKRRFDPQTYQVARELTTAIPWLHGEQPGRLCAALSRFVTGPVPWSVDELFKVVMCQRGGNFLEAGDVRTRPAIVLAALLAKLDHEFDHPGNQPDGLAAAELEVTPPLSPEPVLVPCGMPECNGEGWIRIPASKGFTTILCPNCKTVYVNGDETC